MDFLSEIISAKRLRIGAARESVPLAQVRQAAQQVRANAQPQRFSRALVEISKINIIAEFKRRSPSKGEINTDADVAEMARLYEVGGAAAISVLTEEDYFAGSLDDLRKARAAISLPILRKDFIVDEHQVYESAAAGADAVLLIVAALDDDNLRTLRALIEDELGMDALIEVHTREELNRADAAGARVIGINNRDLRTFEVSIETSVELARMAPRDATLISESGLHPKEVQRLRALGFKGFLVGEALMRADDPSLALKGFIEGREASAQDSRKQVQVKICGITNLADARDAVAAGADLLGFNFYRESPRFIEAESAAKIIQDLRSANSNRPQPKMIGVFVNATADDVLRMVRDVDLDGVQLHGDESSEFCEHLRAVCPQLFQIKAFNGKTSQNLEELSSHPADAIMFDGYDVNQRGGTGRLADWQMARAVGKALPRVFLAGGLSPENVVAAISAVRPFGVDACSSLESSPGQKDAGQMEKFVKLAHSVTLLDEPASA